MFLINEYGLKMEKLNGKFTFSGLKVVPIVGGGMGCHSYSAQGVA